MQIDPIILHFFFPRRCPVCDGILGLGEGLIHSSCKGELTFCCSHPRPYGRSVFTHTEVIRRSVNRFKFQNRREYADFYVQEMLRLYKRQIQEWGIGLIVPVPIHRKRMRERGFNQTVILARLLGRALGIPVDAKWLIRVRNTKAQYSLNPGERKTNVKKSFSCCGNKKSAGNVLLIDDILTTGSTIDACMEALAKAGADKVYFITVSMVC